MSQSVCLCHTLASSLSLRGKAKSTIAPRTRVGPVSLFLALHQWRGDRWLPGVFRRRVACTSPATLASVSPHTPLSQMTCDAKVCVWSVKAGFPPMPPGDDDAYAMLPTASTCKRRWYAALGVCLKDNERYECDRSTPTTHTSSFLWVPTQRRGIPMGTLLFTVEYEETEEKFEISATFEPTNQTLPHESNPRYCSI